jgi:hypothetical protein
MTRASIYSVKRYLIGGTWFVSLKDADMPAPTITNNVEHVLAELVETGLLYPGERVIYRDTTGRWDEIVIDSRCAFVGFWSLNARSNDSAIATARRAGPPSRNEA